MKILLSGATAGTNFGDFLFAKMFQNYIGDIVGKESVFWFTGGYFAFSKFYAKHLNYNRRYRLRDIDLLVYISGGYFGGLDRSLFDYFVRFMNYFYIGVRCVIRRIPIIIIGVEASKSNSRFIDSVQKFLIKKAKLVIVRNQPSFEYISSFIINDPKVICTADSVFSIKKVFFENTEIPDNIRNHNGPLFFYHTKPSLNEEDAHVRLIIPIINRFIKSHPEYTIIVSPDQYSENFDKTEAIISRHLEAKNVIYYRYDNPVALCNVINQCDVVLTDKLHVGIVGVHLGKSVISFSGHTQKIARLYEQLNVSERTIALSKLTLEKGVEMLEKFHDAPIQVPQDITLAAESNFKYLSQFIIQLQNESA